jgi:hypothetical protein
MAPFCAGVSGVLAGLRFQPQHWRLISTLNPGENEQTVLDPSSIDTKVVQLLGEGSHEQLWSNVFHIHCRTSPRFRQGRVWLTGDAAHINSPAGGQGMNSGFQDAHNLAWKLARVLAGADVESLLTSYESERRETVLKSVDRYTDVLTRYGIGAPEFVRKATSSSYHLYSKHPFQLHVLQEWLPTASNPLGNQVIQRTSTLVSFLPRLGLLSLVIPRMGMLDTTYTQSPILSGHGHWLGRRAPDGELTAPDESLIRLFDLAGSQPMLLLFDEGRLPGWDPDRIKQLFHNINDLRVILIVPPKAPRTDGAYVASEPLWRIWNPSWGLAALVRPDDHVGWLERRPTLAQLDGGVRKALGSIPREVPQNSFTH